MIGNCRLCNQEGQGQAFNKWVSDTFTNWDLLYPGEIICEGCLFWFEQKSEKLTALLQKDKPQRMQNYSHFIKGGEWIPLSKADKVRMQELLLTAPFPELAVIAVSGQKHLAFRTTRNEPEQSAGWVQFEEQRLYVIPGELKSLLVVVEILYETFSKSEIETGNYASHRILEFGFERWQDLENQLKTQRGKPLFYLAIFLAQRSEDGEGNDRRIIDTDMEGDTGRLQESLSDDDLEPVRERNTERGVHKQSSEVSQLTLFEN